jgi:hypothetical protein
MPRVKRNDVTPGKKGVAHAIKKTKKGAKTPASAKIWVKARPKKTPTSSKRSPQLVKKNLSDLKKKGSHEEDQDKR